MNPCAPQVSDSLPMRHLGLRQHYHPKGSKRHKRFQVPCVVASDSASHKRGESPSGRAKRRVHEDIIARAAQHAYPLFCRVSLLFIDTNLATASAPRLPTRPATMTLPSHSVRDGPASAPHVGSRELCVCVCVRAAKA